jgi:RimJ/RimL family protein N-acetyltransferase
MTHPVWPFFGLEVRTPRLRLRYVDDALATELALLAVRGVHDPADMPFSIPWTDASPEELPIGSLRHFWEQRAATTPDDFNLLFAVVADGAVVGTTSLHAKDFATVRQFDTGSWLGLAHQGQGLGRELRAATLHLGFAGLGALRATSSAFVDNERSNRVSRGLGYRENGRTWIKRRSESAELVVYLLERTEWEARRREDISIHGLEPALRFLGLDPVT